MKKTARLPSSEPARRLHAIFHRRPTSKWNEKKEIEPFRKLVADGRFQDLSDLSLVERYYRSNWPPKHGKNALRTDLATLLNNWSGELDRAVQWAEAHPIRPKIIQFTPVHRDSDHVETADPEQLSRFQAERLRRKSAFAQVRETMKGDSVESA